LEAKVPIKNKRAWSKWEKSNTDPYDGVCVKVARRAMQILDEDAGDFDTHKLICRADKESAAGGITVFMAGCVASMISSCHSRGEEFRRKWNIDNQIGTEGVRANGKKKRGVLNPALLQMG
jgi:hypothetical protein